MTSTMKRLNAEKSPVTAVEDILHAFGIVPSNVLVTALIEAVRDTTPPPREVTIAMLSKILRSLHPSRVIDDWAAQSSRAVVKVLAELPEVQNIASIVDNEAMWCLLEGTIAGMLSSVCYGENLADALPLQAATAPSPDDQIGPRHCARPVTPL